MFKLSGLYISQLRLWKGKIENMEKVNFYQAVSACDLNGQTMAAVVLDGPDFGQRGLFCGGEQIWPGEETKEDSFFTRHKTQIWAMAQEERKKQKGLLEIEGTRVFCDWLGQEMHLVICGGGHVSMPVIKIGRMMGAKVTVLEDRPQFADNARRAGADEVLCEPFRQGLKKVRGSADTYFVIVTRGHRYDQECLEEIMQKKHAYIGMMGSRRRVAAVKELVTAAGGDREVLHQLYSPIGLDIGAETPEEIGVAIMAEIIQVKNQKKRTCGYSKEILREILAPDSKSEEQARRVLITIVARRGSAPRKTGTKMLVLPDGRCIGTIGGGCMEAKVLHQALSMIRSGDEMRKLCRVDMTGEEAQEEGMVCGGVVDVLLEVV